MSEAILPAAHFLLWTTQNHYETTLALLSTYTQKLILSLLFCNGCTQVLALAVIFHCSNLCICASVVPWFQLLASVQPVVWLTSYLWWYTYVWVLTKNEMPASVSNTVLMFQPSHSQPHQLENAEGLPEVPSLHVLSYDLSPSWLPYINVYDLFLLLTLIFNLVFPFSVSQHDSSLVCMVCYFSEFAHIGYFSHCCHKLPEKQNFRMQRHILAHSVRTLLWRGSWEAVWGNHSQESEVNADV